MLAKKLVSVGKDASLRRCLSSSSAASTQLAGGDNRPFEKILIANRGEIACRVIKTARKMGIATVALYSDIDVGALHVRLADEAIAIGRNPARESYLDLNKVMDAILKTGSQAVHPGYGFLSENMRFSDACAKKGVKFIGPPANAITAMGDKIQSKLIAADAKVNVIPGFKGVIDTAEDAIKIANDIGYPVMMKASAGGGGKGMRVAYNDADVVKGFNLSKREAMNSFNDDRMLVEKFVEDGHHIEIQVIADDHGNVAAFPERECSVQRRHQKVMEESPSCLLTPSTRKEMQRQAILLSKAVGYRSAGTVEMLCDNEQNFFFLEMNTRLQVEHPITEMITGADLVEEMINIAAGRPMSDYLIKHQTGVPFKGNAIEARVYAEDPVRNFLPSTGPLSTYIEPNVDDFHDEGETRPPIRVDSGVVEGGSISMFYDPLICKLISYGPDRANAIHRMNHALDSYVIEGVGHNIAFLRDVCRNKSFVDGKYSTSFIPKEYPKGFHGVDLTPTETNDMVAMAAVIHQARLLRDSSTTDVMDSHVVPAFDEFFVVLGGTKGTAYHVQLKVVGDGGEAKAVIKKEGETGEGSEVVLEDFDWPLESSLLYADANGAERILQYHGAHGEGYDLSFCGSNQQVIVRNPLEHAMSKYMLPPVVVDSSKVLLCPMPGAVVSVAVKEGQQVEDGQELAVVEAMKMQNVLRAQQRGIVKKVNCAPGDTLKVDAVMMEFDFSQK